MTPFARNLLTAIAACSVLAIPVAGANAQQRLTYKAPGYASNAETVACRGKKCFRDERNYGSYHFVDNRYYGGYRYGGNRQYYRHDGRDIAAGIAGLIIGSTIGIAPRYRPVPVYRSATRGTHVAWCNARYRSYMAYDNMFQPYFGPRKVCFSPYPFL